MATTVAKKRVVRNNGSATVESELEALYHKHHGLDPEIVLKWASAHRDSAIANRIGDAGWDDAQAAHHWRLRLVREIIAEVEVVYPDQKRRRVYVSIVENRGSRGYVSLVDVLSDSDMKAKLLEQALAEYKHLEKKYRDLEELAEVHAALARVHRKK